MPEQIYKAMQHLSLYYHFQSLLFLSKHSYLLINLRREVIVRLEKHVKFYGPGEDIESRSDGQPV